MANLAEMETQYGLTHLDHLDRQADIPTVSRLGFQGDVAIIRDDNRPPATTPIPQAGFPVVRGENGGNTHLLVGPGLFNPGEDGLTLGTLTVPDGAQVLMSHPEHGGLLIEPGTYRIGRQREQADEIRMVED